MKMLIRLAMRGGGFGRRDNSRNRTMRILGRASSSITRTTSTTSPTGSSVLLFGATEPECGGIAATRRILLVPSMLPLNTANSCRRTIRSSLGTVAMMTSSTKIHSTSTSTPCSTPRRCTSRVSTSAHLLVVPYYASTSTIRNRSNHGEEMCKVDDSNGGNDKNQEKNKLMVMLPLNTTIPQIARMRTTTPSSSGAMIMPGASSMSFSSLDFQLHPKSSNCTSTTQLCWFSTQQQPHETTTPTVVAATTASITSSTIDYHQAKPSSTATAKKTTTNPITTNISNTPVTPSKTTTTTKSSVGTIPSRKLETTKVPTPIASSPANALDSFMKRFNMKSLLGKGLDLITSMFQMSLQIIIKLPYQIYYYITHPKELHQQYIHIQKIVQAEIHHYWVGTKLLWADIQTARSLMLKTFQGSSLTRRERRQLLRTVTDLFRIIPFSMFVIIPLAEFSLPFFLRIFPNMLPSTFQDSLKEEESMKRELQSRIAMAQFFHETLEELAKEQKRKAASRKKELEDAGIGPGDDGIDTIHKQEDSAASMLKFLENARSGEPIPPDAIIRYAKYFHDDLTLDNMPRMQLINMCRYMSIPPYGSDSFLRFQLRHKIRTLKEDDQRILWEGINSLTKMELREACRERGMRSTGLSKDAYKRILQQWLDLSVDMNVPISLLIMSRTFFLQEEALEPKSDSSSKSLAGLADAISGLDKEVVNEVLLEVATSEEKMTSPDVRKIKLEVLSKQNELIRQEEAAREAAAAVTKKKEKPVIAVPLEAPSTVYGGANTTPIPATVVLTSATTKATVAAALGGAATADTARVGSSVSASLKAPTKAEPIDEAEKQIEKKELSPQEMDAISQLISVDPVSKERAELQRIKAAMKSRSDDAKADIVQPVPTSQALPIDVTGPSPATGATASQSLPDEQIKSDHVPGFIDTTTVDFAPSGEASVQGKDRPSPDDEGSFDTEDPIVTQLKKRIASMVDKIEVKLSQAQIKIGDKLHFLDKDNDGILSRQEMAQALQNVLKRKISQEEANEIADAMDSNKDGIFTVEELIKWIDEHKLVKFVELGRDADMDRVMENHAVDQEKADPESKTGAKN